MYRLTKLTRFFEKLLLETQMDRFFLIKRVGCDAKKDRIARYINLIIRIARAKCNLDKIAGPL